jgi:thiamine-monophosphate kinase
MDWPARPCTFAAHQAWVCASTTTSFPSTQRTYQHGQENSTWTPAPACLNGGEDYELLFTIAQSDLDKVKGNPNLTIIGYMTDAASGYGLVDKQGGLHELKAQGWDAFLHKE